MTSRNPYEVLGVSKDAGHDEVKKAYRRAAMECHPDRNPGDKVAEERFKEITLAYEILSDPDKRDRYDRYGNSEGMPDMSDIFTGFGLDDAIRSFMENFGFGGFHGGGEARRPRGEDIEIPVDLSLSEAAQGGSREIRVKGAMPCRECGGSGSDESAGYDSCRECSGMGRTRTARRTILGTFQSVESCPVCSGTGKIPRKRCEACHGAGSKIQERKISVDVPAGISEGYAIKLRGQGHHPGRGASPGDLVMHVRHVDYGPFQRDGDNLVYPLVLSFPEAALGAGFDIPSVDGASRRIDVPSGAQPGDVITIKGGGMGRLRGRGRGDLNISIGVYVPRRLSQSEKKIMKELSTSGNFKKDR